MLSEFYIVSQLNISENALSAHFNNTLWANGQILKADTIESRERNQSAYDFVFCLFEAI